MIDSIQKIQLLNPTEGKNNVPAAEESGNMFGDIFKSAIQNVEQTNAEKVEAQYLLATGQLDNPAELTIASAKSQLAVELLVQLRNKAVDAYKELTNINL